MIKITCYDEEKTYDDNKRKELMEHFMEGVMACDGSERDRYMSIYCGLEEGATVIDDQWNWS